ncbi:MAG: CHAT domain-containing protein [Aureispira sp.]|nr:CHAT domain-containing protein [Aureispira sp.]
MRLTVLAVITCLLCSSLSAQTIGEDTLKAQELEGQLRPLFEGNQRQDAHDMMVQIVDLYAKHELWEKVAFRKFIIARNMGYMNQRDSSITLGKTAVEFCEEKLGKDSKISASILADIAVNSTMTYRLEQAVTMYKEAERIGGLHFEEQSSFFGRLYLNWGVCYMRRGEQHKALEHLLKSRKAYGPNSPSDRWISVNLVYAYTNTGDNTSAYKEAKRYLDIVKDAEGEASYNVGDAYHMMGLALYGNKRYKDAIEYYTKSLNVYLEHFPNEKSIMAERYMNIGATYKDSYRIYDRVKDSVELKEVFAASVEHLEKAIELYIEIYGEKHASLGLAYRNLGFVYWEQSKDPEKALEAFHKAVLTGVMGTDDDNIHSLPDFESKELVFSNSNDLYWNIEAKYVVWHDLYKKSKDTTYANLALKAIRSSELLMERELRKATNSNDRKTTLGYIRGACTKGVELNVWLYQETNDIAYARKAFEYAEKSKSILLLSTLQAENAGKLAGLPQEAQEEEKSVQSQIAEKEKQLADAYGAKDKVKIAEVQDQLFDLNRSYDDFVAKMKSNYPQYYALRYNRKLATVKDIQEHLLDVETQMIEYYVTNFKIYAFAITKDGFDVSYSDIYQTNIEERIQNFIKYLTDYNYIQEGALKYYKALVQESFRLYDDVLQLKKWTANEAIKKLIIVPDSWIHSVPFECVISEAADTTKVNYENLKYLLHSHDIQYSYTAGLLLELENWKQSYTGRILGLAASYDSSNVAATRKPKVRNLRALLQPLIGATKEIQSLEAKYKGDYKLGAEASEGKFKEMNFEEYDIVHFAMHGLVDKDYAMGSSLAFTEDNDTLEDNFLHAYEIMNMDIPVELVILSACETGNGIYESGEGVISIGRSFMYAGASSIMMTLWEVHDMAMSKIMESFYSYLEDGLTKTEALRQAKIDYLKGAKGIAAHPFFWAPSIILGNNQPLEPAKPISWWWIIGGVALGGIGLGLLKKTLTKKEL